LQMTEKAMWWRISCGAAMFVPGLMDGQSTLSQEQREAINTHRNDYQFNIGSIDLIKYRNADFLMELGHALEISTLSSADHLSFYYPGMTIDNIFRQSPVFGLAFLTNGILSPDISVHEALRTNWRAIGRDIQKRFRLPDHNAFLKVMEAISMGDFAWAHAEGFLRSLKSWFGEGFIEEIANRKKDLIEVKDKIMSGEMKPFSIWHDPRSAVNVEFPKSSSVRKLGIRNMVCKFERDLRKPVNFRIETVDGLNERLAGTIDLNSGKISFHTGAESELGELSDLLEVAIASVVHDLLVRDTIIWKKSRKIEGDNREPLDLQSAQTDHRIKILPRKRYVEDPEQLISENIISEISQELPGLKKPYFVPSRSRSIPY
jgi:hypothetical protein